jgi:hypothetical protein
VKTAAIDFLPFTAIVGLDRGMALSWTAKYTSRNLAEYIFIEMTAQDRLSKAYDWN